MATGPDRLAVNTDAPCAVVNCLHAGRPQVCMYDGRYHHHGCIHYETIKPSSLTFRDDGWHWVCDEHYAVLRGEMDARQRELGRVV